MIVPKDEEFKSAGDLICWLAMNLIIALATADCNQCSNFVRSDVNSNAPPRLSTFACPRVDD